MIGGWQWENLFSHLVGPLAPERWHLVVNAPGWWALGWVQEGSPGEPYLRGGAAEVVWWEGELVC